MSQTLPVTFTKGGASRQLEARTAYPRPCWFTVQMQAKNGTWVRLGPVQFQMYATREQAENVAGDVRANNPSTRYRVARECATFCSCYADGQMAADVPAVSW